MPQGAAITEPSSGENISHFASIRIRVTGVGNLKIFVYALDYQRAKTLVPIVMSPQMRNSQTRLVNFMEQRATFDIRVEQIDERFRINRIVIFSKQVYKSYPGN